MTSEITLQFYGAFKHLIIVRNAKTTLLPRSPGHKKGILSSSPSVVPRLLLVTILNPAKNLLNGIRTEMCSVMPEASQELGNIGNLLSEIVTTTNQSSDVPVNTIMANADALQILEEAEIAAESRLKDRLPEVANEAINDNNRRTSLEA